MLRQSGRSLLAASLDTIETSVVVSGRLRTRPRHRRWFPSAVVTGRIQWLVGRWLLYEGLIA